MRPLKSDVEPAPVSIICPTFNQRPEWLRMALTSVIAQSRPPEEVIIVTAEGDVNAGLLLDWSRELSGLLFRAKLVTVHAPGVHAQWREGMLHASGKYVSKCDSDDFLLPHKLEHEVRMLETTPGSHIAYTGFFYADETLRPGGRFSLDRYTDGVLERSCVIAEAALIEKRKWANIGFLDLEYGYASFWDSMLKLTEEFPDGVVYDPTPSWLYRLHKSQVSTKEVTTRESQELRWKVVKEHFLRAGRTLPDWEIEVKTPPMKEV